MTETPQAGDVVTLYGKHFELVKSDGNCSFAPCQFQHDDDKCLTKEMRKVLGGTCCRCEGRDYCVNLVPTNQKTKIPKRRNNT